MESNVERINQFELLCDLIKNLMDVQRSLYDEYKRIYEDGDSLSYSAKVAGFRSEYSLVMHVLQVCTERLVVARHELLKIK